MFKFKLGEEVRQTNYSYYKDRCLHKVVKRHYNEYLSSEGELLYDRTYDLQLVSYDNRKPSISNMNYSFAAPPNVPEQNLISEEDYQLELKAKQLKAGGV